MIFGTIIFCLISYGVRYRLYMQHIKMGRRLDFSDRLDIDLDDVSQYPPSVYELYQEKQKYDSYIKRKDEKIYKISDQFHEYLEKRATDTIGRREKRGLKIKKRKSPLEDNKAFERFQMEI